MSLAVIDKLSMRPFQRSLFRFTSCENEPDRSGELDLLSTCSSLGDLPAQGSPACEASGEEEPVEMHSSPVYLRKVSGGRKSLLGALDG